MKLERAGVASFRVTLHGYELAALASVTRWAVEGADGDLPDEARAQLRQILAAYESELARLNRESPSA